MKWVKVNGQLYTDQPFIKKVSLDGKSVCLVGFEGKIFALNSTCPHAGEDLSRGWCSSEGKLVCPYHRFSYDLVTGKGSPGQNDYVDAYEVKINNGNIYVGFETFKEKFLNMFK